MLDDIKQSIRKELSKVTLKAKFHADDVNVILEGLLGLAMARAAKDPLSSAAALLGVFSSTSGKMCLKTIGHYLKRIEKGLFFGEAYKSLVDSSELDFSTLDVALLPEMMQVRHLDCPKGWLTQ